MGVTLRLHSLGVATHIQLVSYNPRKWKGCQLLPATEKIQHAIPFEMLFAISHTIYCCRFNVQHCHGNHGHWRHKTFQ